MERLGDSVERELARGGSKEALPLAAVTRVWTAAVGDTVARNAWPARIGRDGTLHVNTTSSTWAFELEHLAGDVENCLREALGEAAPVGLRFAPGPVPEPPAPLAPEPLPRGQPASPETAAEASAAAALIEDPDLRELAARAARASLARTASDRRF